MLAASFVAHLFSTPWFGIGLTLALLGLGNWDIGLRKTQEYELLLSHKVQENPTVDEFPALTPQMNAALLRPLRRAGGGFTQATGKVDFYRLVRTGGEIMMLAGLFVSMAAAIHTVYRRRGIGVAP